MINLTAGHSRHVTVIVPETATYSKTWKCGVTSSTNTGFNMRTTKQRLSQSYGKKERIFTANGKSDIIFCE